MKIPCWPVAVCERNQYAETVAPYPCSQLTICATKGRHAETRWANLSQWVPCQTRGFEDYALILIKPRNTTRTEHHSWVLKQGFLSNSARPDQTISQGKRRDQFAQINISSTGKQRKLASLIDFLPDDFNQSVRNDMTYYLRTWVFKSLKGSLLNT